MTRLSVEEKLRPVENRGVLRNRESLKKNFKLGIIIKANI